MKKNILIFIILIHVLIVSSQQWIPDTNKKFALWMGGNGYGYSLYSANDTLYLGGGFLKIGSVNALRIARYYNGNWYPLKGGVDGNPSVFLFYNGQLYITGFFSWADNKPGTMGFARWDGNDWWPVGAGDSCASCYTFEKFDNKIFLGGNNMFGMAWGVIAWDGTNWVNKCNLPVTIVLHNHKTDLLGGYAPDGFMKFEGGTTWSLYPYNSTNGTAAGWMTTDTINNFLYLSGAFYFQGNPPVIANDIAMWDGFEWHPMGMEIAYNGSSSATGQVKVYNGYLYAAINRDTLVNGTQINCIGRWDGEHWQPMGTGLNQSPNAFEEFHDTLFVAGGFTTAGGDSAYGLARWYMPDTNCAFLQPTIHTLALEDTFCLSLGQVNVQFFNNNAYAQSWQWDFGDSGTDNTQNPVHTYTNDSAYTITVTVTQDGCTKTDTATIWVEICDKVTEEYTRENLHFKIYPNPTSGDFTIECTLPQNKTGKVKAFRNTGSQLGEHPLESGSNNFVMPSGNWKDSVILVGVYIDGRQVLVEKVVKE